MKTNIDIPVEATRAAVMDGRLSTNPTDKNFHGRFVYVTTTDGVDQFKHIRTGEYLSGEGDFTFKASDGAWPFV